jgi:uncharacterized protein
MLNDLGGVIWPGPVWLLIVALLIATAAGAVRGFAGFGFSALVVAGLTPFVQPGPVVVAVLVLEVMASARLVRVVAGEVDRAWHRALLLGNLAFVPVGVAALVWLSPEHLRLFVSSALLTGALALRATVGRGLRSTLGLRAAAGAASGLLGGLAASGGMVAALLMAATRPAPSILRSTMISFLLWVSAYALLWSLLLTLSAKASLVGVDALRWALLLAPAMWLGMRLGASAFGRAGPQQQQIFVLNILIATSGAGLAVAVGSSAGWFR